tara:strand:+ start:294 stop:605 length:312 start_codon:yes stop_codon:yes gene_type:complete
MATYFDAIIEINPEAEVKIEVLQGETETYDKIQWLKSEQKIDKETLDAKITELNKRDAHIYPRQQAYPSVQDQLDMQYHDQVNGTTTWKDAIAKVKSDNPKSE